MYKCQSVDLSYLFELQGNKLSGRVDEVLYAAHALPATLC